MVAFMTAATSAFKWLNTDALPPLIQIVIGEAVAVVGHALDHHAAVVQDPDHEETAGADQTQDPGPAPRGEVNADGLDHVMIKNPGQNQGVAVGPGQSPGEMTVNPNPDQNQVVVIRRNPDQSPGQSLDLGKDPDPGQRRI
jgi:hypothetical protein